MARLRGAACRAILALCLLLPGGLRPAPADVVVLSDGDRITGKVVAKGARRLRLRTPYGLLVIPREKIERIKRDDGTEEVLNPPPTPPPTPAPAPSVRLVLVIEGSTFWQAWSPRFPPEDISLRLDVRLDDMPVAAYVDGRLDPEDLPGALVNSFSFFPESLSIVPGLGVEARWPEIRPGRIELALDLPAALAGLRQLSLAYETNDGSAAHPSWRVLAVASLEVELRPERPARVGVQQDRGAMEFKRRQMRGVETFQLTARVTGALVE